MRRKYDDLVSYTVSLTAERDRLKQVGIMRLVMCLVRVVVWRIGKHAGSLVPGLSLSPPEGPPHQTTPIITQTHTFTQQNRTWRRPSGSTTRPSSRGSRCDSAPLSFHAHCSAAAPASSHIRTHTFTPTKQAEKSEGAGAGGRLKSALGAGKEAGGGFSTLQVLLVLLISFVVGKYLEELKAGFFPK